tara:strand:+ start:109 stop:996 length:888 start_codon:yes stop_codon:yes gene_type:complete
LDHYRQTKTSNDYIVCDPLPTEDQLAHYYKEEFYQALKPNQINDSSLEVRDRDKVFYDIQYGIFCTLLGLDQSPDLRHVDIGCGYGHFLDFISNNYPQVKLMGCEVFDESREFVSRIPGADFNLLDLNDFNNFSELLANSSSISLINALEHLREPDQFLRSCFEFMPKASKLLLQVPNDFNPIQQSCVDQMNLDEWWFCPPRHISYFTPSSLASLCNHIGFNIDDLITTFPIDLFLLSGINYRNDPSQGRVAHNMRLTFEKNYSASHGLSGLLSLYRHFAHAGIGREIVIVLSKP